MRQWSLHGWRVRSGLAALSAGMLVAALRVAHAQPNHGPGNELPPYNHVEDPAQRARVIASLQEDLKIVGIPGRIRSCEVLLDIRHEGRNNVYGAICNINSNPARTLLMCNDDGIGHFALAGTFPHDPKAVERFARANCAEGPWEPIPDIGEIGNTTF